MVVGLVGRPDRNRSRWGRPSTRPAGIVSGGPAYGALPGQDSLIPVTFGLD
jgi:hypothetical protein